MQWRAQTFGKLRWCVLSGVFLWGKGTWQAQGPPPYIKLSRRVKFYLHGSRDFQWTESVSHWPLDRTISAKGQNQCHTGLSIVRCPLKAYFSDSWVLSYHKLRPFQKFHPWADEVILAPDYWQLVQRWLLSDYKYHDITAGMTGPQQHLHFITSIKIPPPKMIMVM